MSYIKALLDSTSYSVKKEGNCESYNMKAGTVTPQSIIPVNLYGGGGGDCNLARILCYPTHKATVLTTKYVSPENIYSASGKHESCYTVILSAKANNIPLSTDIHYVHH
jgi:hypothetical protein